MVVVPGPERGEKSKRTTAAQPAAATPGRRTRGASRRSLDKEPGKKVDKSKGAGRYQVTINQLIVDVMDSCRRGTTGLV